MRSGRTMKLAKPITVYEQLTQPKPRSRHSQAIGAKGLRPVAGSGRLGTRRTHSPAATASSAAIASTGRKRAASSPIHQAISSVATSPAMTSFCTTALKCRPRTASSAFCRHRAMVKGTSMPPAIRASRKPAM